MSLTEKRKYYACDNNYVTLKEVETWPDYFTRSATRLVKKASKSIFSQTLVINYSFCVN